MIKGNGMRIEDAPNQEAPLNDRERVLCTLVQKLQRDWFLRRPFEESFGDYDEKPKVNDLVLAQTGGPSPWTVGFYEGMELVEFGDAGHKYKVHLIRDLASGQICRYENESFIIIKDLENYRGWVGRFVSTAGKNDDQSGIKSTVPPAT